MCLFVFVSQWVSHEWNKGWFINEQRKKPHYFGKTIHITKCPRVKSILNDSHRVYNSKTLLLLSSVTLCDWVFPANEFDSIHTMRLIFLALCVLASAFWVEANSTVANVTKDVTNKGILNEVGSILENAAKINTGCVESGRYGCHKGYCWSYCTAAGTVLFGIKNEWCYTTKGSTQDRNYIKCSSSSDCDACWKCGGPCALF